MWTVSFCKLKSGKPLSGSFCLLNLRFDLVFFYYRIPGSSHHKDMYPDLKLASPATDLCPDTPGQEMSWASQFESAEVSHKLHPLLPPRPPHTHTPLSPPQNSTASLFLLITADRHVLHNRIDVRHFEERKGNQVTWEINSPSPPRQARGSWWHLCTSRLQCLAAALEQ